MEGKLKKWNEEKGFGFISSNEEPKDIFIHISALKKMSRRPVIGDIITFQIDIDNKGKKRAVSASIKGVSSVKRSATKNKKHKSNQPIKLLSNIAFIFFLAFVGYGLYSSFIKNKSMVTIENPPKIETMSPRIDKKTNYSCQGKEHCSEMSSCSEAVFYLENCEGTKIDGNGDGVPCEMQWCNNLSH